MRRYATLCGFGQRSSDVGQPTEQSTLSELIEAKG